jgi:hypothetical protein
MRYPEPKHALVLPSLLLLASGLFSQDGLSDLAKPQNYISRRISSYDRSGGNRDALTIAPGETAVLADIAGPGAIHHIWVTIAAEPFSGRKIVLRMYWDGERTPSVEAPIGDFFGVGHGLNRDFSSLPLACSSNGRAKNSYWYMPFLRTARVSVTNEGSRPVAAFYYYIDYRVLPELAPSTPTFHAQYRQETPCLPERNYLLLEAEGTGHYVGSNLSVLQQTMGWWGEGDDMIFVDGETAPSLHGTGSEDYFSDAWGMRQDENLFYGCPLQEEDFQAGAKATVYRFHIPDPIPFRKSIRVTIEHGHANDRADNFSSVAYWYQTEPHRPFPAFPPVEGRLPYALEPPDNFVRPQWEETNSDNGSLFEDKEKRHRFFSDRLSLFQTSYYGPEGRRYSALTTEGARSDGARAGTEAALTFPVEVGERYRLHVFFLKGPRMGVVTALAADAGGRPLSASLDGYSEDFEVADLLFPEISLVEGDNSIRFRITGKNEKAQGEEFAFVGMSLIPSSPRFLTEWNLIGPFDAPDMDALQLVYPPEKEVALKGHYRGKSGVEVSWKKVSAEPGGLLDLYGLFVPHEQVIAYGLAYVHSPDNRTTHILLGSDDGVRVWLNDELIHSNPVYRSHSPDQDRARVMLKRGWNKVLIKVLQGAGGWGFSLRLADPHGSLTYSTEPQ